MTRQAPIVFPEGATYTIRGRQYVVTPDRRVFVRFETGTYLHGVQSPKTETGRELKVYGPAKREALQVHDATLKIKQAWIG